MTKTLQTIQPEKMHEPAISSPSGRGPIRLVRDTCTACERHLYGSRETLVRLVRDTCTAREQHLHGSRATLVSNKGRKKGIKKGRLNPSRERQPCLS